MSKNQRPTPSKDTAPVEENTSGEIVTGVPITDNVPAGAPQYATFEQHAQNIDASNRHLGDDPGPIEDRDNRAAPSDGKNEDRLPIHEVDALAAEMAGRFASGVDRTTSELDGNTLTVTVVTRHGPSKASAQVKNWTRAGVQAALAEIEDKMNGNGADAGNDPDKTLADAVRAAVKA